MKKLEIIAKGSQEDELGRELLESIYKIVQNYESMEVAVLTDTVTGGAAQNFGFWSRKPGRTEGRG